MYIYVCIYVYVCQTALTKTYSNWLANNPSNNPNNPNSPNNPNIPSNPSNPSNQVLGPHRTSIDDMNNPNNPNNPYAVNNPDNPANADKGGKGRDLKYERDVELYLSKVHCLINASTHNKPSTHASHPKNTSHSQHSQHERLLGLCTATLLETMGHYVHLHTQHTEVRDRNVLLHAQLRRERARMTQLLFALEKSRAVHPSAQLSDPSPNNSDPTHPLLKPLPPRSFPAPNKAPLYNPSKLGIGEYKQSKSKSVKNGVGSEKTQMKEEIDWQKAERNSLLVPGLKVNSDPRVLNSHNHPGKQIQNNILPPFPTPAFSDPATVAHDLSHLTELQAVLSQRPVAILPDNPTETPIPHEAERGGGGKGGKREGRNKSREKSGKHELHARGGVTKVLAVADLPRYKPPSKHHFRPSAPSHHPHHPSNTPNNPNNSNPNSQHRKRSGWLTARPGGGKGSERVVSRKRYIELPVEPPPPVDLGLELFGETNPSNPSNPSNSSNPDMSMNEVKKPSNFQSDLTSLQENLAGNTNILKNSTNNQKKNEDWSESGREHERVGYIPGKDEGSENVGSELSVSPLSSPGSSRERERAGFLELSSQQGIYMYIYMCMFVYIYIMMVIMMLEIYV